MQNADVGNGPCNPNSHLVDFAKCYIKNGKRLKAFFFFFFKKNYIDVSKK